MTVTINGQQAEIGLSGYDNTELTLYCRYPSTECMSITFHTISSQVEVILKKYGVSHVSNFWLGEVPFLQVGFSCEQSLKTFLCSQQEMQTELGPQLSTRLRERQTSVASASPVSHGLPVEVETELFLVLPDADDNIRAVSFENYKSCLALWKESEKFDFGALFRAFKLKAGGGTTVEGNGELTVNVLVSELSDVVDWFHFGLYLGVPHSELLTIEADHRGQTKRCKTEMLDWWISNEEQPTLSTVVKALLGIRMRGLAEKIAVKYCVALPTDAEQKALEALPLQSEASPSTACFVALLEKRRMENGRKSEQLQRVLENLKQERLEKINAKRRLARSEKELMTAHKRMASLSKEKMEIEKLLRLKEKELSFLHQVSDKSNRDLNVVIESKEAEIALLREQLGGVNSELSQAREEARQLREQLQQATGELEKQSTNVRDLERARADLDRERSRVDMMIMQLCGRKQSEEVAPAELETLHKAVVEKEKDIERLCDELEAKETEKQKLLEQVEKQSHRRDDLEDQLVQLTSEVSELRTNLVEAKDGRVRAEIELEDLKSRRNVVSPASEAEQSPPTVNESESEKLHVKDKYDGKWWLARSLMTGKEGYIPSNYIASVGSIQAQEWFFSKIKRNDAEKKLLQDGNPTGTFLVRESECQPGDYSLCVRNGDGVRHYRITATDNGEFYITSQCIFSSLDELVQYYSHEADSLCCQLTMVCPKVKSPTAGLFNDEWEVERSSINLTKRLYTGQFGEVWEGIWSGITPIAVKVMKPGNRAIQDFLAEACIMKKLQHRHVVQLYAVCSKEEPICIVMELMKRGSLLEYLRGEGRSLELPQLINMSAQVAAGMAYLEQQNYIHRNLAARNILVDENMICKVADFGLARTVDEDIYEAHIDTMFPIKWTAPEAATCNRFSFKSDVWSYGILLYEVITYGRFPYPGMANLQVLEDLQQGYRMPRPKGCPDKLYEIMLDCWREDPASRPTFDTLQFQMEEFFTVDTFCKDPGS